jgi:molybdopterin converting factor small subunit
MRITVKYSGILSEILGVYSEEVEVPENTTIGDLLAVLAQRNERLRRVLEAIPVVHVHVNEREVSPYENTTLRDRDAITLSLPLFEGG